MGTRPLCLRAGRSPGIGYLLKPLLTLDYKPWLFVLVNTERTGVEGHVCPVLGISHNRGPSPFHALGCSPRRSVPGPSYCSLTHCPQCCTVIAWVRGMAVAVFQRWQLIIPAGRWVNQVSPVFLRWPTKASCYRLVLPSPHCHSQGSQHCWAICELGTRNWAPHADNGLAHIRADSTGGKEYSGNSCTWLFL